MPKEGNSEISTALIALSPESEQLEVESFGMNEMSQILIPALAIISPAATAIVTQILQSKNMTIKYDGIELTGNYKTVTAQLETLLSRVDKKERKQ
jgi:branched-subunit amino acid permease